MSGPGDNRLLHIRSLNHLAREHQFTYVGARILAESLHPSIIDAWTKEYIARKTQTGRRQVYWKHSIFKGFDCDEKPESRKCVIGSPTTCLTEVWLLKRLSQQVAFAQHPNVYSYFWSREGSQHIFRYFLKGYMERETRIARAAVATGDAWVVILDLKQFYPSIAVESVRRRFARRIERTDLTPSEQVTANRCVEELTSIRNETGLPIGPPLSHMLANVFLEDFDARLRSRFGDRYFRYVDDVAIVVPRDEVQAARQFFELVAAEDGLRVNADKADILTGNEWAARVEQRKQAGRDSFAELVRSLRLYLAHNADDFERVRDLFREEGFNLPFARLRSVAVSSSPFRRFARSLWSKSGGLFRRRVPRPEEILKEARQLRRYFNRELQRAAARPLPSSGMARRWAIQDLRFLLNRLLYLLPSEERVGLLSLIPKCLELRPSRTVLEALLNKDASELTKYPGPTLASFCELWRESMSGLPTCKWSQKPAREERDAASVLALSGLCSPPEAWTEQLCETSSQVMAKLSSRRGPRSRTFDDFSYIDEMESLLLKPDLDIGRLLTTRFDDGEDVVLPTLSLGSGQYVS